MDADHRAATQSARQAYEAIKYSAPNKMGFMRVVQVIFAIHIVLVLLSLVVTSRNTVVYSNANILTWIMCILEGVAFWLFVNRYKVARPFVIGMGVFGLLAPTIYTFATDTFSPFESVLDSAWYIFLILYFTLSKRVRSTLVNDFSEQDGDIDTDEFEINRTGWPFIRNLICYFIVFHYAFQFFVSFATEQIVAMPKISDYLDFVIKLILAFGFIFEMPIFSFFLSRMGVVTAKRMRGFRRYAVLLVFIVAAILTPPDVVSQLLMAVPMLLLYEVSILVAAICGRKPKPEPAEGEDDGEEAEDAGKA